MTSNTSLTWDDLPEADKLQIWNVERVLAASSLFTVLCVFVYVIFFRLPRKPLKNPAERLIIYTFVAVAFEMAGKLIAQSSFAGTTPGNPSLLCKIQSFFIEFGNISTVFWALAFCWDLYTVVRVKRPPENPEKILTLPNLLLRRERLFIPGCYGLSLIIAIICSVAFSVPDDFWCWAGSTDEQTSESLSLGFFYAWVWPTFLLSILVMLYALYDWSTRQRDWKVSDTDIRPGCVVAFSVFLFIDLVIWLFASINRFQQFSHEGIVEEPLLKLQAWPGSARGLCLAIAYYILVYQCQFKEPEEVYDETDSRFEVQS